MIIYDFAAHFWKPIELGTKTGTIRRMRTKPRRHAQPGEALELWAEIDGQRRQIARKECADALGILVHGAADRICLGPLIKNRSSWPELDAGGREGLARVTGHEGWKGARNDYETRYGEDLITLCLITWRDREYDGQIPTREQMRDLRILTQHTQVIPRFGKISPNVAHSLLVYGWAEVTNRTEQFKILDRRGNEPIRITERGRWILDRFEK